MRFRPSSQQVSQQNSGVVHHLGRQRRQRSAASPNSSLSSYSPPWTMTQRPQSQSVTWPEDDVLTDDGEGPSVATAMSSWQEEAHWMSFRNAVQYFSTLTIHEAPISESLDGSAASSFAPSAATILSAPENPPPLRQIGVHSSFSAVEETVRGEHAASADSLAAPASRLAPPHMARRTSSTSSHNHHSHHTNVDLNGNGSITSTSTKESLAYVQSMASDLAETKMRLALAQAERDELEFALINTGEKAEKCMSGI